MIAYFFDISTKLKVSTLCSNYSMLRATLSTREDVDMSKYSKLRAFLKLRVTTINQRSYKFYQINKLKRLLFNHYIYFMNKVRLEYEDFKLS